MRVISIDNNAYTRYNKLSNGGLIMRKGFTLAEVLITLGVIGIVAAMTLPGIFNKAEKMILKNQFKKSYSVLENALMRIYADNGTFYRCHYNQNEPNSGSSNAECVLFKAHLKKVLNPVLVCDKNAYEKGCIPKYKGIDTILTEKNASEDTIEFQRRNCGIRFQQRILNNAEVWVLKDGTIIGDPGGVYFWVDINGNKRPNKWGHDLFDFTLLSDVKKMVLNPVYGGCMVIEEGGVYTKTMLQNVNRSER